MVVSCPTYVYYSVALLGSTLASLVHEHVYFSSVVLESLVCVNSSQGVDTNNAVLAWALHGVALSSKHCVQTDYNRTWPVSGQMS